MKILHKIMQSFRRKQPSCPGLPPPVPRRATAPDTGKKASDPTTPSREPLRLTIGLDFGTSTAKCIVHTIMGREQAENRFLCPISGKDLFSTQAWQFEDRVHLSNRPDGPAQPLDSPKIAMRNLLLDKPGARFDPRDPSPDPKALCWALLSHCTQEIRQVVEQRFPHHRFSYSWDQVQWSMGAPLDGMMDREARHQYAALLWSAVHHPLAQAPLHLDPMGLHDNFDMLPSPTEIEEAHGVIAAGNCFIHPEAMVAINTFLQLGGNLENGIYLVTDIGAGTTDFAFFRFTDYLEKNVAFYGSASVLAGGNDLASAIAQVGETGLQEGEQEMKENLGRYLPHAAVDQALRQACATILQGRRDAFRQAFRKERSIAHWKRELQGAALSGGGSRIAGFRQACLSPLPTGNGEESIPIADLHIREEFPPGATFLHQTAYGLSIPPQRFHDHWRLDEVEDFTPSAGPVYQPMGGGDYYAK